MENLSNRQNRFADAWDIAQVLVSIAGIYCAYRKMKGYYVFSAFSAILMLMALEAIVKKQINVRGKIVKKDDIPMVYFSMIAAYLVAALVCIFFALVP